MALDAILFESNKESLVDLAQAKLDEQKNKPVTRYPFISALRCIAWCRE
jgi:hypothetical protein